VVIVHVLSSFGLGGQEKVALDLAAGQVRRGHRVAVVSLAPPPDGPLAAEFAAVGASTHSVAKGAGIDATLVPRLAWAFRKLGARVVHSHNPLPLIYGAPAARLAGAVAIHTKHGANPGSSGHLLLRRQAARCVSFFAAVSQTTAEQARDLRDAPADKIVVVTNGIQLDRFHPDDAARAAVRLELGIPASAFVVVTVGRVDEAKNQVLLVNAMAPMLSSDVHLVIIGDGPARGVLESAISGLPAPRLVHMLGRRMDVARLLPAFDVFAMSSRSEGLPLVLPEAMSAGLPVVSTAVGGIPDVIEDGVTGILCPVDEGALRGALTALQHDRERVRKMGKRARTVAQTRYSADRMLDDYMSLYERALAR
jgi:glycosyltransferase involved in cell wall biosynthesis